MTIPGVTALQFGDNCDVTVVGAGIVGLAVARAVLEARPSCRLVVLDKEPQPATHQSGRNSGVLHAGLYYRPSSHKARLCVAGRAALEAYCDERGIAREQCGKVVVATRTAEVSRLLALRDRAVANGLDVRLLDRHGLADHEPHADGLLALHVPATGVVDFGQVTRQLADDVVAAGGSLRLSTPVESIEETRDAVGLRTPDGTVRAAQVVACAGLQSDRLARASGAVPGVRIVPFRGEYLELVPSRRFLVRHLIYPVPDPRFPFLGAHFTRGIDGSVHAGPNAVPALAREGYTWSDVCWRDVGALAIDPAVRRLAARYWRTALEEVVRSRSRRLTVAALQRLVPDVRDDDLVPAGSGVRAQAIDDAGELVDDFAIERHGRVLHVLNAPSPAATSSLAIGGWVADLLERPVGA